MLPGIMVMFIPVLKEVSDNYTVERMMCSVRTTYLIRNDFY